MNIRGVATNESSVVDVRNLLRKMKDERTVFTFFIPVECSNEYHGASMARFPLSAEDMLKVLDLANIGMNAGAAEITTRLYCEWSSSSLRTNMDRLVVSPPESEMKGKDDVMMSDMYIECKEADSLDFVQSNSFPAFQIVNAMINARANGETQIMFDPVGELTLHDLADYFPDGVVANKDRDI